MLSLLELLVLSTGHSILKSKSGLLNIIIRTYLEMTFIH